MRRMSSFESQPVFIEQLEPKLLLSTMSTMVTGGGGQESPSTQTEWLPLQTDPLPPHTECELNFTVGEMLADPQRNIVYLLDQTDKKVVAMDTDQGWVVDTADLAGTPNFLAISPDDTELYVTLKSDNKIQVFSLPDMNILRTLTVSSPDGIAAGVGGKLYVASNFIIDAQTGDVLGTFPQSGTLLRTNLAGTELFIWKIGSSPGNVGKYDISGPTPVKLNLFHTPVAQSFDLAIDEQYGRLYTMSDHFGMNIVDMQSGSGSLWQFDQYEYGVAVGFTPSSAYVWAGSAEQYGGRLFYYNRASGDLVGHVDLGGDYYSYYSVASRGIQVTPNGNVIYKATSSSDSPRLGIIGLSSLSVNVGKSLLVSDSSGNSADKSVTIADTRIGQLGTPQTFTLSSSGTEPLTITGWTVLYQAHFIVTVQDNQGNAIDTSSGGFVIPAGADYTVTVTLNSATAGSKSGIITFKTNDIKNSSVTLNVRGLVGDPVLSILNDESQEVRSIDFGLKQMGADFDMQTFVLNNNGTMALNVSGFDISGIDSEDFSVSVQLGSYPYSTVDTSSGSFTISPGQSYYIQTQFVSETVGAKSGTISFNTNDDNNPTVTLSITGEVVPSPDLTISISQVSPQYAVYIPGDRISMVATISNIGAAPAVVDPANPIVVNINLGDETAYGFYIPFTLDAGAVIERQISFYLPEPGVYDIVAIVDCNSVVTQPDYENNYAYGETLDVEAAFGEIPGRSGNLPLRLTDSDGTQVTMKLTGGGTGILDLYEFYDGYNYISITGSTANSRLEILTANSGAEEDDGRFVLDGLTVGNTDDSSDYTSLGAVEARTTDLAGDIYIAGTLGSLQIGDVYGVYGQAVLTICGQDDDGIATGHPASLQFRRVADLSINSSVRIKSLSACCWLDLQDDTDFIYAPSLGTLTITGSEELNQSADFQANIELYGPDGGSASTPTLGKAKIANNVAGSEWLITGNVGQVEIGGIIGNLDTSWTLDANRIDKLKLGDVLNAGIYAGSKVNLITSERWQMGTINAETIGSLITTGRTGRRDYNFAGNFNASVTLQGLSDKPESTVLRSAKIAGQLGQGAWDITGPVGSISAKSVVGDWTCSVLGEFGKINALRITDATATNDLELHANAIGTFTVAGSLTDSHIYLDQGVERKRWAMTNMKVSGAIIQSEVRSYGNISSIVAGSLNYSNIFVGVKESVTGLPASGSDFNDFDEKNLATIRSLKLLGIHGMPTVPAMINSNVAAGSLSRVSIPRQATAIINTIPGGQPFGFATHSKIGSYRGPTAADGIVFSIF